MNSKHNIAISFNLKHISDIWAPVLSLDTRPFYRIQIGVQVTIKLKKVYSFWMFSNLFSERKKHLIHDNFDMGYLHVYV